MRHPSVIWSTSGHGGSGEKPKHVEPLPDEVVLARERLRKAEAEYFAKAAELREAVTRAERKRG